MRELIFAWCRVVLGLLVFALGVHLTILPGLGLAPWDCLGMGMAGHLPLNYGLCMTLVSCLVLGIDLAMGEKIGLGTVTDALLTGNFVELFNRIDPFSTGGSLPLGLGSIALGLVLMALGQMIYMRSALGCGPRDALLLGLGKRLKRLPIGIVEVLLWALVLLIGWLLGGPVGIGTLASTFGAGLAMQAVYTPLGFEPRTIEHESLGQTIKRAGGRV